MLQRQCVRHMLCVASVLHAESPQQLHGYYIISEGAVGRNCCCAYTLFGNGDDRSSRAHAGRQTWHNHKTPQCPPTSIPRARSIAKAYNPLTVVEPAPDVSQSYRVRQKRSCSLAGNRTPGKNVSIPINRHSSATKPRR